MSAPKNGNEVTLRCGFPPLFKLSGRERRIEKVEERRGRAKGKPLPSPSSEEKQEIELAEGKMKEKAFVALFISSAGRRSYSGFSDAPGADILPVGPTVSPLALGRPTSPKRHSVLKLKCPDELKSNLDFIDLIISCALFWIQRCLGR